MARKYVKLFISKTSPVLDELFALPDLKFPVETGMMQRRLIDRCVLLLTLLLLFGGLLLLFFIESYDIMQH